MVRSLTNLAVSELLGVDDFICIGGSDVLHDPTVHGCRIGVAQNTLTALGSLDLMSMKQFPGSIPGETDKLN